VVPAFAPFLAAGQPAALQAVGVCLIDDAVEFGGEAAAKYVPQALAAFARGMQQTDDAVLRQSATYGIAQVQPRHLPSPLCATRNTSDPHPAPAPALPASQVARLFPQQLAPQLGALLPLLLATATHPEACEEEREGTTENAVFALGALATLPAYRDPALQAQWAAAGTQPAQVAALWLQRLPLKVGHDWQTGIRGDVLTSLSPRCLPPRPLAIQIDEAEAKLAHRQLCDAVERGDTAVLGEGLARLPEVMRVFSEVRRRRPLRASASPRLPS